MGKTISNLAVALSVNSSKFSKGTTQAAQSLVSFNAKIAQTNSNLANMFSAGIGFGAFNAALGGVQSVIRPSVATPPQRTRGGPVGPPLCAAWVWSYRATRWEPRTWRPHRRCSHELRWRACR